MARSKKTTPFYIVFKNDLNHPYFKNSTRKIPQYEIWKEFDATL